MIQVTKPFLPPKDEFFNKVTSIYSNNWLTNNGPILKELEAGLTAYLGLNNFNFLSNGTLALQLAIKSLELEGEIITTPFSYVATSSSIVWEGCTPIYADIDPDTLNVDVSDLEKKIGEHTSAILVTHVFGNPCDVISIDKISKRHNLPVIYDASHAFGVTFNGMSLLNQGDVSTISFHATKLFHTIEGGGVVTKDDRLCDEISYLRNFGHDGYEAFKGLGINAKNSEFHAAMGLCNLKYADEICSVYKRNYLRYRENLITTLELRFQQLVDEEHYNFAYFPVVFKTEEVLNTVKLHLEKNEIYPRRYFYPSLNRLNYVSFQHCPVTESVSNRILCLPMYYDLKIEEVDRICQTIMEVL